MSDQGEATRINVTDEAIEAAAMAIYLLNKSEGSGFELDDYRADARVALTAAAPYLRPTP